MISKTPLNDQVNAGAEDAPALVVCVKKKFANLHKDYTSAFYTHGIE